VKGRPRGGLFSFQNSILAVLPKTGTECGGTAEFTVDFKRVEGYKPPTFRLAVGVRQLKRQASTDAA